MTRSTVIVAVLLAALLTIPVTSGGPSPGTAAGAGATVLLVSS